MKRIEYKIQELNPICNNVIHLKLVPKNEEKIVKFRPGQYGLLSFLRGNMLSNERPFSFASSPTNKNILEFGFKIFGDFTDEFSSLKEGDSVFVKGPYGSFIFNEKKHKDVVFISAGIGITPFLSTLNYATANQLSNKFTLLFCNKTIQDIAFYDEIKNLEKLNPNIKTVFNITNTNNLPTGFISGRINSETIVNFAGNNIQEKTFFICGPESFTNEIIKILKTLKIKRKNIKTEGFSLAPKSFFEKGTWAFPMVVGTSTALMLLSLYTVYQAETANILNKNTSDQLSYEQQIVQMNELNNQIIMEGKSLLKEQENNTIIKESYVPQTINNPTTTQNISKSNTPSDTSSNTTNQQSISTTQVNTTPTTTTQPTPTTTATSTPTKTINTVKTTAS